MKSMFVITGLEDAASEEQVKEMLNHLSSGRTRVKHTVMGDVHLYVFTFTFWNWLRSLKKTKKRQSAHTIHRIVAEAFIKNPENKPQVNHINRDKTDNRIENLEWCTRSENMRHAYRELGVINSMKGKYGKFNGKSKSVLQFTKTGNLIAEYESCYEASRHTDASPQGIARCCRGLRPSHSGYIWRYK